MTDLARARIPALAVWACLLTLGLVLMHDPPQPAHQHAAAMAMTVAAAPHGHSTTTTAGGHADNPMAGCGVHSHDCMGVGESIPYPAPGDGIVEPAPSDSGVRRPVAGWLVAAGGRDPPWTVLSLSQLSILRV
jgi:hypothetical protein